MSQGRASSYATAKHHKLGAQAAPRRSLLLIQWRPHSTLLLSPSAFDLEGERGPQAQAIERRLLGSIHTRPLDVPLIRAEVAEAGDAASGKSRPELSNRPTQRVVGIGREAVRVVASPNVRDLRLVEDPPALGHPSR